MILQQLLCDIDARLPSGRCIVTAIDGPAASGKSTLAEYLRGRYSCNVIPMDHFFLRPEQRTQQRLAEPGGNIDYERFLAQVVDPLNSGKALSYSPYDCATERLRAPITPAPAPLTVIEGVYSLRPEFACAYDIRVFVEIAPDTQRKRLQGRSPALFERFEREWLPMERKYFEHFNVREICDYVICGEWDWLNKADTALD